LLLQSQNKEHWLGQFIRTHMVILEHEPLPELRILKAFWLFGSAILIFLIIWTSFYMPSYFVIKIYYLFFKNQYLFDKNLIVIHLMQAIGVFLMLNMMNRFLSKYLATHYVSHTEDIAKYQRVFFILGIVVAFVLSLRVSNLYMESVAYLLGGLALGAGVGLQPVIANFCAGIYLLLKHPFIKGDLIALASVKGVVKKIGIMEILIESFDKVQLNIPNATVFKTIVYNYSSSKHHPPKIQLLFSFEEIAQLETYKTCLLDILGQEKQVLMKGLHPPELLLFVKDNVYELALVCSINHFSKIEQVLAHLTASFIDHLHIHQPSLRLKDARMLDG
jgi:small-conductance mechanosensitive channel